MKKAMLFVIMATMCLFCATTASALEPAEATVGAGIAANAAYEASVINAVAGRAGAAAPTGAKGVIFEKLYATQLNLKNLLNGAKTMFTKNSTAQQVDLVTMKDGKVLSRIQCKDTPNSAKNVLNQVKTGKYQQAQLVGTTESAAAYNAEAAKRGISKTMKDSGISTKTTSRIADKSLGQISTFSNVTTYIEKAGVIGAAVDGGICLIESLHNGDDAYTTIGHVTAGAGRGFATGSTAALAGEATTAAVVALGGTGVVTVVVPVATAFGVAYLAGQVADNVIDEQAISAAAESIVNFAQESGYAIVNTVSNICGK